MEETKEMITEEVVEPIVQQEDVYPVKKKLNLAKSIGITTAILYLICGLVVMGIGVYQICSRETPSQVTERTNYAYYGGDAYTGIQHAATDTSNNTIGVVRGVYDLNANVCIVIIVLGLMIEGCGISKFESAIKEGKKKYVE